MLLLGTTDSVISIGESDPKLVHLHSHIDYDMS
jgi:hypothetical protein